MATPTLNDNFAREVIDRMHLREIAILPGYKNVASDLRQLGTTDLFNEAAEQAYIDRRNRDLCAAYGFESSREERKPFAFTEGIAIIPVSGMLINRFHGSWGWVTGYNAIRSQMNAALADPDVTGLMFDLNSNGGEVAGCFELVDEMFAARGKKPMMGVIDSACYSACYAIASALDKIVCAPSGGAGSIGVVAMHVSYEKLLDAAGISITFIHAGKHKVDGNPYEDLTDDVKADIQASVDKSYDKFTAIVARNRDMAVSKVKGTEARVYRADAALSAGLVDAIASPIEAMQAFFSELGSNSKGTGAVKMATNSTPGAANNADPANTLDAGAVRTAERARIAAICGHAEAAGRSDLANHIAYNTDMGVDDAVKMLAASPKATAAASVPAAANRLNKAMENSANPEVGAEGDDGAELTTAQRIAANHTRVTGVQHKKLKLNS